ncbi:MAG: hypothetical protein JSU70_21160 [Phycisphaerales bacterium]|nr:MAG: hypothetical protein JSU70_21160 [Phycisphaerales bacterium]
MVALEKENQKLQKRIAKLQAKDVSQENEIAGLKKAQAKVVVRPVSFGEIPKGTKES